jgi:type IV secretory pathway TrbD component
MDGPREILIHASCVRPHLLLGGDRELVLALATLAVILAFALMSWWGVLLALALWILGMWALVRMGKSDAVLRHVYLRHVRYHDYYPARSGRDAQAPRLPTAWR